MNDASPNLVVNGQFAGVPIRMTNLIDTCDQIISKALNFESPETYRLINAYSLALADTDPDYHRLLSMVATPTGWTPALIRTQAL